MKDKLEKTKQLNVIYRGRLVGVLAENRDRNVAFSYDEDWLRDGFSINPFSLPLKRGVFVPSKPYFDGLFGVFSDSLPDYWGRLLQDRMMVKLGMGRPLSALDRLALSGDKGNGALEYEPCFGFEHICGEIDFDMLHEEALKILRNAGSDLLSELYQRGGSSGGTRPKVSVKSDDGEWIVKFPAETDQKDAGLMEYEYYRCALRCGINMSESRLFASEKCAGYFGTRRFDRLASVNGHTEKLHTVSASGLLELDFNQPSLDYRSLFKLTNILTNGNRSYMEEMYRRMCFNFAAHNLDDHGKNFAYIYDEKSGCWALSPAFDLTYSNTFYNEHTTALDGNGTNPEKTNFVELGKDFGLGRSFCESTYEQIFEEVESSLSGWMLQR